MKILFLDDDQYRHEVFLRRAADHAVTSVYDADAAIERLNLCSFDVVYLDHDLGGESSQNRLDLPKDGRHIARWIAAHASLFPSTIFVIHSLNFEGSQGMMLTLRE